MKEIMDEIQQRFELALEAKTNWGRNEIKQLYNDIAKEVYLEKLSQLMDRK
jgi:hypothetical protein